MNTQLTEEVTTVENSVPSQVVKKTTTQIDPLIKQEAPQKVFDKKKKIFRINQKIWYILGAIEVLLGFRFILKALAANPDSGFTNFIYAISGPFALPFRGILAESISGNSLIEWSSMFAAVVYLVIAGGLVYLLDLINPVSQEEVEMAV